LTVILERWFARFAVPATTQASNPVGFTIGGVGNVSTNVNWKIKREGMKMENEIRYKVTVFDGIYDNQELANGLFDLGFTLSKYDHDGMFYRTYNEKDAVYVAKAAQKLAAENVAIKEITNDEVTGFIDF
jgi:hypothetical protein